MTCSTVLYSSYPVTSELLVAGTRGAGPLAALRRWWPCTPISLPRPSSPEEACSRSIAVATNPERGGRLGDRSCFKWARPWGLAARRTAQSRWADWAGTRCVPCGQRRRCARRRRRCFPPLPPPCRTPMHSPPSLPAGIMAHITAVRLKAFKSVAGGWQEFRFDRGLNAIVGECVSADEAGRRQLMLVVGVQVPPAMLTGCLPSCRPQRLRQVIAAGCPLLCLCGSAPHVCRRLAGRPGQQRQQRGAQQLLGLAAECAAETCMSAAPRCTTLMQPVLMLALCPGVRGGSQPAQRRRRGTHGGGSSHARRRPRLQGQRQVRQCMQSSVLLCAPCVLVSQRLRCTTCALLASQLPAAQVRVRSGGACAGETLLTVQSALSFIPPANLAAG